MKRFSMAIAAVAFCTFILGAATADAAVGLRGIGLKAGLVEPEDFDMTVGVGLVFDLGYVHPNIALESYAGYWQQTEGFFGYEYGIRDFSFGAKGKYVFQTSNPTIQPFLGTGLGFHVLNAHVETSPVYLGGTLYYPGATASDTELQLGLDLGGGLRIDTGSRFAFIGEGWFSVVSDAANFSLMAGAVYMFGR